MCQRERQEEAGGRGGRVAEKTEEAEREKVFCKVQTKRSDRPKRFLWSNFNIQLDVSFSCLSFSSFVAQVAWLLSAPHLANDKQ